MAIEKTFFMIKPSGVERDLIGAIVSRVEARGLSIRGMKLMHVTEELAKDHYAEHKERPFFGELIEVITRSPVVAMVVEGESAITIIRTMMGATNPVESAPGTIRGDFATELSENIVHGSDSPEAAKREIELYFSDSEIVSR